MKLSLKQTSHPIRKLTLIILVLASLIFLWKWSDWTRPISTLLLDPLCAETVLNATRQKAPPGTLYPDSPTDQSGATAAQEPSFSSEWAKGGRRDVIKGTITIIDMHDDSGKWLEMDLLLNNLGTLTLNFTEEDLSHMKVVQLVNGQEMGLDLAELYPMDTVTIEVKTDYSRPVGSNQEFKITKL